jgi:putative spermidine/putrescine transport system ATP-binding protein
MAQLHIEHLAKNYGNLTVVDDVSLTVADGEFVVLLGPSGCGKTTTLRMTAGFVTPSSGLISIGSKDVTTLPPWRRNCGLVFQSYALFPHMTVSQNVAFGLEMRKIDQGKIEKRVVDALRLVRLDGFGDRYPRQMSGGQQQRVALARALAIEPDILLLDEPLSNLDAKLRVEVRQEIRELQRKLGITTVLVTHDQEEALTVADRLVVMSEGRVRQIGSKRDIYERPADRYVASFIGQSFFIDGRVTAVGSFESNDGLSFVVPDHCPIGPSSLALRPERVMFGDVPESADNRMLGRVEYISYLGAAIEVHLRVGESTRVVVQVANREGVQEPKKDDELWIGWAKTTGLVYPLESNR